MSIYLDDDDRAYEERIRRMVLVDTELNDRGDEIFCLKYDGEKFERFDDILKACDRATEMSANLGVKWDVTIQARNAGDMS